MPTRTDKVPNTSATAASAGADLNGAAVVGCVPADPRTAAPIVDEMPGAAFAANGGERLTSGVFRCLRRAITGRRRFISIPRQRRANRFHYYAYAAAVSEVEVDGFTGDSRVLRTDILEDAGDPLSPLIDRGQIEGGFVQGLGWLTIEELVWDAQGRLATARRIDLQAAFVVAKCRRSSTCRFSNEPPNQASSWAARRLASLR